MFAGSAATMLRIAIFFVLLVVATTTDDVSPCFALATNSTNARCLLASKVIDCGSAPVPLETTARLQCRSGYKLRENHPGSFNTNCTAQGWRPQPITCDLDCGRRGGNSRQLRSVGGKEAKIAEFPWHVAIFREDKDSFKYLCGGSLVSLNFFISAAHCFWDERSGTPRNKTIFKAVLGKLTLTWESQDEHEQRRDVNAIHIPESYTGRTTHLEGNIALVELSAPLDVTPAVNVVCVDWGKAFKHRQLSNNSMGTVPGWGLNENDTLASTLRFVDLPFVPKAECRKLVPSDMRAYLVGDKFCGGFINRTAGICRGDSGGGFVFPKEEIIGQRYYLRGVASNSLGRPRILCSADLSAYTKISAYPEWLEDIVFSRSDADEEN